MIVVDAPALIETLFRRPGGPHADFWLFQPGQDVHAPHLLDLEIARAVRRDVARGDINAECAAMALDDLAALAVMPNLTVTEKRPTAVNKAKAHALG